MALTFNDQQATALLEALGLDANADADVALATVKDAVTASIAAGAQPSAVAAAARLSGLEVLDADTAAALRRDATEGRKLAADAARAKIDTEVDDAISKGKIPPARRQHWATLISNDASMSEVLAGIAPETAVPLTEIGHGVTADEPNNASDGQWFY